MESNRERIETALGHLREAAVKAREPVKGGSVHEDTLKVVYRLTPDAMEMAMAAHTELAENMGEDLDLCGEMIPELVVVLNGLKALVEVDGVWVYEDGRWINWVEHRREAREQRQEVAK